MSGTELADEFNEVVDMSDFPDARGRMPNAEEMIDRVIDLVEQNANADFFIYAHLMDTHFPHAYGGDAEALAGPSKAGSRAFDQHDFAAIDTVLVHVAFTFLSSR